MVKENMDENEILEAFAFLKLTDVDSSWTERYYEGGFCEFYELPDTIRDDVQCKNYCTENLSKLNDTLYTLHRHSPSAAADDSRIEHSSQGFWSLLLDHDLSLKTTVALLASYIGLSEKGSKVGYKLLSSVLAARAYIQLVCIPGSQAYKIFHPTLFEKCVDVLKLWPQKDGAVSTSKRKGRAEKKGRGKNAAKRQKRGAPVISTFESDEEPDSEEDMESVDAESSEELVADVCNSLFAFAKTICYLLEAFSLKAADESCAHLIQTLAQMTRQDDPINLNRSNSNGEISALAFKGLETVCREFHGNASQLCRKVCESLMPNLLMTTGEKGTSLYAGTIPKAAHVLKEKTLVFIKKLCSLGDAAIISSIRVLIQHLASNVAERSEYRGFVAQTTCYILQYLPSREQQKTIEWIQKFSKNAKISSRIFALETISALLEMSTEETPVIAEVSATNQIASDSQDSGEPQESTSGQHNKSCVTQIKRVLLQTIISRCSDKAPTVRAKALSCVQLACSSRDEHLVSVVKDALFSAIGDLGVTPVIDETGETLQRSNDPLSSTVIHTLRKRTTDGKVLVRKAAVQAVESAVVLNPSGIESEDIRLLHERCMDESLSVRKQAIVSLTEVLKAVPQNKAVQSAWLDGVLPCVIDKESTVQDKCCLLLEEAILDGIVDSKRKEETNHTLAWDLMKIVSGDDGQELSQYLSKVCEVWSKQGKFNSSLIKKLISHIESDHNKSTWLLLAEISSHFSQIDKTIVITSWRKYSTDEEVDFMTVVRVLKVLAALSEKLSDTDRTEILDDLKGKICGCQCSPEIISAGVTCISKLYKAAGNSDGSLKEWCESVMSICEKIISDSVLGTETGSSVDESLVTRSLFTLGEVAQLCPTKTSERMFMMVQSFLFSEKKDHGGNENGSTNDRSDMFRNRNLSPVVRAHAFVTLGKLCLQNEDLAKSCIAAIARELEMADNPVVRNNVIVVMCDLCVRYTNLVDRYVSNIASCLKDSDPLVRRQTLTLLTHLLSEDFVKWRGSLFFKFVMAIVDESEEIRKFSEFCLVNLLLTRHPNMFSQHFIECIFYFNSYEKHKVYNQFFQTESEKKRFSLKGESNYRRRLQLYRFLLNHLNDEQKFNLTGKLCHEVLGCVIDGEMDIDQDSGHIIRDVLAILGSKEIKLSSLKNKVVETEDEILTEQQQAAVQAVATARAKIITQVVKRNMIENIIPIIVALKHELEKRRSPLIRYLMRCLKEIVKDYRSEVQDVLAADRQLANEIEYDIKKFEERQKELESEYREHRPCVALGQSPLFSPSGRGVVASEDGQPFLSPRLKSRANDGKDTPSRPVQEKALQSGRKSVSDRGRQPLLAAALINSAKKAMEQSRRASVAPAVSPVKDTTENRSSVNGDGKGNHDEDVAVVNDDVFKPRLSDAAPKSSDSVHQISKRPLPVLNGHRSQPDLNSPPSENESEDVSKGVRSRSASENQTSELEVSKERVASTPEVDRTNPCQFTFLADLSVIVKSPVPGLVKSKGQRKSARGIKKEPDDLEDQVICLPSPERTALKQKVWNIQSPLAESNEGKDGAKLVNRSRTTRRRKK